jgi:tryptophan synthase alpha chain
VADGAVVGSAIVDKIGAGKSPSEILAFVKSLADGAHSA